MEVVFIALMRSSFFELVAPLCKHTTRSTICKSYRSPLIACKFVKFTTSLSLNTFVAGFIMAGPENPELCEINRKNVSVKLVDITSATCKCSLVEKTHIEVKISRH